MSGKYFLKKLIELSPLTLSQGIEKSKGKYKEAAVACVLRMVPSCSVSSNSSKYFESPLDALSTCHDFNVEILFIKRAERERDRWSGHVAFPGGYLDEGESDLEAVCRELKEEIGVDVLDSSQYAWLGRLNHRFFGPKSKLLFPHIFLYLGKSSPELILEPKEISSVRWINANVFLETDLGCGGHLSYPINVMFTNKIPKTIPQYALQLFARLLGFSNIYFPCVRVPLNNHALNCSLNCGVECESGCWVVWGITYNTLRCLVSLVDKHKDIKATIPAHAMNYKSAFWIDNALANVFIGIFDKLFNDTANKDRNGYSQMIVCSIVSVCGVYTAFAVGTVFVIQSYIM